MTDLTWMLAPVVVCLVAVAALGWFGLHVLQRGVIFVDLALAQMAALGATYAVYLGHDPDEPITLLLSLLFTMFGALAFASIRQFEKRVPQEAIIGIAYAVSAALGVLLIELAADPHGAEKVQHLMVGNIVWVRWSEIATAAVVVAVVGLIHITFRKRFLAISLDAAGEARRGVKVALWDLLFYMSFGAVLTAIVSIIGVLLVFSFLVIPAVVGRLFSERIGPRLLIGYSLATMASVVGVSVSYEHSTGPIIVALLGSALALALGVVSVRQAARPGLRVLELGGALAVVMGVLWGFGQVPVEGHHHEGEAEAASATELAAGGAEGTAAASTAPAGDPLSLLQQAVVLARGGDPKGLESLAHLTQVDEGFIRMEADDRLRAVAGASAPTYDAMGGPDSAGLWTTWAATPPEGWQTAAAGLTDP